MGQTEAWDMTKGGPLALTLMNLSKQFRLGWSRGDRAGVSIFFFSPSPMLVAYSILE